MNEIKRKTKVTYFVYFKETKWMLNIYMLQSDTEEIISDKEVFSIINNVLKDIEKNCISEEFVYFRTGFALLHYGNRGINLSIWHVGQWGNTYEIFKRVWYCYNRDYSQMELLDDAEPVLCQYELMIFNNELCIIADTIGQLSEGDCFREKYIDNFKGFVLKNDEDNK